MRRRKKLIEQAYTLGAQLGLSVWCEDEAGPFQAVPQAGVSWQPREHPAKQPHEYIRGGTTKILTLFHPATGQVRLQPATRCTNAVLHPWLRERLSEILATLPPPAPSQDPAATPAAWTMWQAGLTSPFTLPDDLPTPFVWNGKRRQRRRSGREHIHRFGGSGACTERPIRGTRATPASECQAP